MRTNLTYIVLGLSLFYINFAHAQELGKKTVTSPFKNKKQTSLPVKKDSTLVLNPKDSIISAVTKPNDSIKPKEVIEGIISHDAEDYTIQNAKEKTLTLYNKAHITYTNLDLQAGIIILDYKNNTVYAKGIKDSLGYHQRPVFKQGNQESEQDSILFNFKTKKALVYGVKTVQGEMITYGEKTKRVNDSTIYMRRIKFTTSQKKNPDYYIATNKAKLVPGKKIIVGSSNLVLADVPTPLFLPFAYFPLTDKRTSGFIIPSWGQTNNQGFFLQNGGYYFALSDYFDLTTTGDIYTNGSWGLRADSNYKVRYKFNGSFSFQYQNNINSIKGLSDYSKNTQFNIRWSHSQDTKSSPNSRFSASVNLGSSKFFRESLNERNIANRLTNTFNSSISYYKKFVGTPFNMNVTATHSQNSNTEKINMTLPSLQVNMDRIYPFVGKNGIKKNPIQKIGVNYNLQSRYDITTTDDEFFTSKMFKNARTGVKQSINANTNIKAFKYFTLSPNLSFDETWYFKRINKRWDPNALNSQGNAGAIINDTISGFSRFHQYNIGASLSTTIYGNFPFKKGRLKAIRHTIRPSVSYGYRPNFAKNSNLQVQQSSDPNDLLTYSPFTGGIYGAPGSGISNSVNFSVNNVLEAKVAPKDPDSDEEDKKITILNNLNFSTGYNFTLDSLRWSPLRVTAGTRLFKDKLALNSDANFDFYQVNSKGNRIDKFNKGLLRLTSVGVTANYSISSKDLEKGNKGNNNSSGNGAQNTPDVFGENINATNNFNTNSNNNQNNNNNTKETKLYHAKIPWTLSLAYAMRYNHNGLTGGITSNSLMFSGNIELTPKWSIGYSSAYDFERNGLGNTNLSFSRDLDSWRLNFNWTPFGQYTSYYFFIGIKSSMLSDLKWDKNSPPDRALF